MRIITFLILFICSSSFAKEVPPVNKTVNDYTGLIKADERTNIDKVIRDYFTKTTNQIGVLVIDSLDGYNLEEFSHRVFTTWKLGDAKKDNGVLLLFVIKDRKFRIEVGQGLEGSLTDVESKRIQSQIKPYLKQQQYGQAVLKEVELVIKTIDQNEAKEEIYAKSNVQKPLPRPEIPFPFVPVFTIFFGLVLLFCISSYFMAVDNIKKKISSFSTLEKSIEETKESFRLKEEKQKRINKEYAESNHKKEDDLKEENDKVIKEIDKTHQKIKELLRIAKKYGVEV